MTFLYLLYSGRRFKIGIASKLRRRVKQVNDSTKGNQRIVIAVDLPFKARQIEAYLHRRYKHYHAPLKSGSGRSEWFKAGLWVIEAIAIMLGVALVQWGLVWLPIYITLLIFTK